MVLSLVIRSSIIEGYDSDISNYILLMQRGDMPPYFLREFIFFYSIRFLYDVIGNGAMVFVVLDFLLAVLIYKGFSLNRTIYFPNVNIDNIRYIYFGAFLFFPYVLGMHTVYRQLLSTAVLICAIGYAGNHKLVKGFSLFLISIFIHNATGLFLPLLFFVINKLRYKILSVSTLIAIIYISNFVLNSENAYLVRDLQTSIAGQSIAYLYLLSLCIIVIAITISEIESKVFKYGSFIGYLTIMIVVYGYFVFIISSGMAERVVFFVFALMFPMLAYYCEEKFKPKIIMRLIYFHVALSPLFFLHNTTIDITFW